MGESRVATVSSSQSARSIRRATADQGVGVGEGHLTFQRVGRLVGVRKAG
jgi:hypothetical protein